MGGISGNPDGNPVNPISDVSGGPGLTLPLENEFANPVQENGNPQLSGLEGPALHLLNGPVNLPFGNFRGGKTGGFSDGFSDGKGF